MVSCYIFQNFPLNEIVQTFITDVPVARIGRCRIFFVRNSNYQYHDVINYQRVHVTGYHLFEKFVNCDSDLGM